MSVPMTSTSKPATPRSRISSSVCVTPCMPPTASATSATRTGSRWGTASASRAEERGRRRVRHRRGCRPRTAREQGRPEIAPAPRSDARDRRLQLALVPARGAALEVGVEKPSDCSHASSSASLRPRPIDSSQARSSARASSGRRSPASGPLRASPWLTTRSIIWSTAAGSGRRALSLRPSARRRAPSPRAPTWRPSPARRAPRRGRPAGGRGTRPAWPPAATRSTCARCRPGVIVGPADADAAVCVDVDRGREVELATRASRCGPPRRGRARRGGADGAAASGAATA